MAEHHSEGFSVTEDGFIMVKISMQNMINDPLSEYHEIKKIKGPELIAGMHSLTPNTMKFGSKKCMTCQQPEMHVHMS